MINCKCSCETWCCVVCCRVCLFRLYTQTLQQHLLDFALVIKSCRSTVRMLLDGTQTRCSRYWRMLLLNASPWPSEKGLSVFQCRINLQFYVSWVVVSECRKIFALMLYLVVKWFIIWPPSACRAGYQVAICFASVSYFFFLMISVSHLISASTGWIFTRFSPFSSTMAVDD